MRTTGLAQPSESELQETKQTHRQPPEGRLGSCSCHAPTPYELPALQQSEAVGPGSSSPGLSGPVPTLVTPLLVGGKTGWQDTVGANPAHVSLLSSWQGLRGEQGGQLSWQVGGRHVEGRAEEEGRDS